MQITLYSGFSKENNSTKIPAGGTDVSCVLKEETSLIKPVFILQAGNFQTNYVKWNNRYYFVDDVVSIRNDAVELHCVVDPLASWKSEIGSSSQYVTRSASQFDTYVVDGIYPSKSKMTVSNVDLSGINVVNGSTYVVGVISGESNAGAAFYAMTSSQFADLMDFMFSDQWMDVPLTEISVELQKELVNPFQYIVSVDYYPFDYLGDDPGTDIIKFGYWDSDATGLKLTQLNRIFTANETVSLPKHPQASRGKYLNGSPFTFYEAFVYVFGKFAIDPVPLIDHTNITFTIIIDLFSGDGILSIMSDGVVIVDQISAKCSIPIQISQLDKGSVNSLSHPGQSLSKSVFGMAASIMSGDMDWLGTKGGAAVGAYSNVKNAFDSSMAFVQSKGAMGSLAGWLVQPYLIGKFYEIVAEDNDHLGRPLMQRKTISSLSGFIQVENPDIDIPATEEERSSITRYMQQGFYYE